MIIVSACLAGCSCRYDASAYFTPWIYDLVAKGQAFPLCPEQLGGLSTPRLASELNENGSVINQEGEDVSCAFMLGAQRTLAIAKALQCQQAILKSRSPSCGRDFVYSGNFEGKLVPGDGITAQYLIREGIAILNENEAFNFHKPYDVIWFDLDETLMDFKTTQLDAFKALCKALGLVDPSLLETLHHLYETYNHPLWKALEAGRVTMDQLRHQRVQQFLEALEREGLWPKHRTKEQVDFANNVEAVVAYYEAELGKGNHLIAGSLAICQALKNHYKIGLITNGIENVQVNRLSASPLKDCFDAIFISETLGYSKPDPRIFDAAARAMDIADKSKILMIGDSLVSDVAGGNAFGIDTCWFNPLGLANKTEIQPTIEVQSFDELEARLLPHAFWGNPGYHHLINAIDQQMAALDKGPKENAPSRILMAIDGYCGSGKTTLGALLQKRYRASLVTMDHFYLPEALKTAERKAIPGHNIHHERVLEEVLKPLASGLEALYHPFDCKSQGQALDREGSSANCVKVEPRGLVILEGSYSCHPSLVDYYDLRCFVKTRAVEQEKRIGKRNGLEALERFRTLWIPYEMAYFEAYAIEAHSQVVIET